MHTKMKIGFVLFLAAALSSGNVQSEVLRRTVPHEEKWGIYMLDLTTEEVNLIYSYPRKISGVQLNETGDTFVFSQKFDGDDNEHEEICTLSVDGTHFNRLTSNNVLDTYPSWSPDSTKIAFLSWRDKTMDIYMMNADGSAVKKVYDSGGHDGDIHWLHNKIVFTRDHQIWIMNADGTGARQITDPPRAGEWGNAVLPFGDYDPKLSPDGSKIVFERMVDDKTSHGNYDIYCINTDGSQEVALTNTGYTAQYTQGIATWSYRGDKLVYFVTAIGEKGVFDIYIMNADGTNNTKVTPDYFPDNFLCHLPIFSLDDSALFFIGEWWGEEPDKEDKDTGGGAFLVVLGFLVLIIAKRKKL
jgi:Tol biopolymer transport system component